MGIGIAKPINCFFCHLQTTTIVTKGANLFLLYVKWNLISKGKKMLFFVKLKEENNLPETINQVLPSFEVIFLNKMKKV